MATGSDDSKVKIWNVSNPFNWQLVQTFSGHTLEVKALEFAYENTMVSGSRDNSIRTWLISNGVQQSYIDTGSEVRCLLMLDSSRFASAQQNGHIYIYNLTTSKWIYTLEGHTSFVDDLVLISSNQMASSCNDKTIRIWDLTTKSTINILSGHTSGVTCLKLVNSGTLASGSYDGTVRLWDLVTGTLKTTFDYGDNSTYWALDFINDGQTLVKGSIDKTLRLTSTISSNNFMSIQMPFPISSLRVFNTFIKTPKITSKEKIKFRKLTFSNKKDCIN